MRTLKQIIDAGDDWKIACGRHENRYGEDDNVWDLTCEHCFDRLQVLKQETVREKK